MSESFEGRYMLVGPKVYITPDSTVIFDDNKKETLLEKLPAGIWIWVECNAADCGIPSHWIDIRALVEGYTANLQEWYCGEDIDPCDPRYARDIYPT